MYKLLFWMGVQCGILILWEQRKLYMHGTNVCWKISGHATSEICVNGTTYCEVCYI
jgi:hypothetical protein